MYLVWVWVWNTPKLGAQRNQASSRRHLHPKLRESETRKGLTIASENVLLSIDVLNDDGSYPGSCLCVPVIRSSSVNQAIS